MNAFRFHARYTRWLPLALWLSGLPLPGHANETIRQVQEELRKRDLYFGDIDGRPTPQVAAAVRNYQQRKGFSPTGELDDTTLRSLQLLPALPAPTIALIPSATASTAEPAASPWPDITILRSDEARRADAPPASPPRPTPTPAPAPAAASRRRITPEEARAFLARYLQAGQTNDTPGELAFYGSHVDYFDEGVVDQRFIAADVTRYDRRWPQRQFTLLDPVTVSDSPDGDPEKAVAHFRYAFVNKGGHYTVQGKTDNEFTLVRAGPESLRIVGMKEQRVREK